MSAPTVQMATGLRGEELAAEHLRRLGFAVVARNWRSGRYELDIVARRGDELHFVEVKTRRAGGLTAPEEALTPAKRRALRRAAEAFMAQGDGTLEPFFDLVAVEYDDTGRTEVRLHERAIEYGW